MDISARSFLSFSASLTVASAIAVAPLPLVHPIAAPTMADVRLAASPTEIEAAIARFQGFFDEVSVGAGQLAVLPGRGLAAAAGGIEDLFDIALTRMIDDTADLDTAESLTILRTLAVDAWAMLEHNVGRINQVISSTTEDAGKLLSGAVTGSAQHMLIAIAELVGHPLAPQSYAGVLAAALDSGRLVVGNGLRVVHEVGGAGFDIAQVVVDELTFQVDNLIGGFSALLTHVGDTSASPLVAVALGAVRDLVLAPVQAIVDAGSQFISTVVSVTHAGFDRVLDAATDIVDPPTASEDGSETVDPEPVEAEPSEQRVGDSDGGVPVEPEYGDPVVEVDDDASVVEVDDDELAADLDDEEPTVETAATDKTADGVAEAPGQDADAAPNSDSATVSADRDSAAA